MNICVIGLGSMGRRRIRLLKEVTRDALIIGVDNNTERVQSVKKEYDIACYHSLDNVKDSLDCAFVCTPPQFHASIIRECLQRELHVFSEINLLSDLYEENKRLAQEKGKVLFLSSTPMYKEEMQYIDKRVKQSRSPCVYQYHVGQYLPDWHPWDNLKDFFVSNKMTNGCREYLAIELPWMQRTFGKILNFNVIKRKITGLDLDFPDVYMIQNEHENGNVGSLLIDVVSRQAVHHLEVFNEEFYIRWDGTPDSLWDKDIVTGEMKAVRAGSYKHEDGYADFINETAYAKEIDNFFETLKGGEPLYNFTEDQKILQLIDEIER